MCRPRPAGPRCTNRGRCRHQYIRGIARNRRTSGRGSPVTPRRDACDDHAVDADVSFGEKYGPWGVVLGASEGLGAAWAHGLAARGLDVVVAARRADLLQRVADDVAAQHGVSTRALPLD